MSSGCSSPSLTNNPSRARRAAEPKKNLFMVPPGVGRWALGEPLGARSHCAVLTLCSLSTDSPRSIAPDPPRAARLASHAPLLRLLPAAPRRREQMSRHCAIWRVQELVSSGVVVQCRGAATVCCCHCCDGDYAHAHRITFRPSL